MNENDINNSESSKPFAQHQFPYEGHLPTPNSTEVLLLGIFSIVLCWCYGFVSVVLGIITLVLAAEGEKRYRLQPHLYTLSSYKNLRAGKTCAIIGLCFAAISIIGILLYLVLFGTLLFNIFNLNVN